MGREREYLAYTIHKIAKEEPTRADEELLPSGSVRERNTEQRPCLLLPLHRSLSISTITHTERLTVPPIGYGYFSKRSNQ